MVRVHDCRKLGRGIIKGADMIIIPANPVVYRGTITDLRISAPGNGTHDFLDNCAALVPYADGNHLVEIYPSGGGALGLKGFLKAQGAGEVLGDELLTSWTNYAMNGFDTFTTSDREISAAVELTSGGRAYSGIAFTVGKLYKVDFTGYTLNSGTAPRVGAFMYQTVTVGTNEFDKYIEEGGGVSDFYFTGKYAAYIGLRSVTAATNFAITDTSVKEVTAPSTTGVTITSTKGGTNYNFAYKNAGFVYNAASYYVVVRKVR
jgi:hypothetical protein